VKKTIKRVIAVFMAILMVFGSFSLTGFALNLPPIKFFEQDKAQASSTDENVFKDGYFEYTVDAEGNATITGYDRFSDNSGLKKLIIPSVIGSENHPVKAIGDSAFEKCSFDDISIPDSIEEIGGSAFINTPFYDNKSNWDESGNSLYKDNCLLDTDEDMIGGLVVKEGTRIVADDAIGGAYVTSIFIPSSVEYIGRFGGSFSLEEITVDKNNSNYISENGILYNKKDSSLEKYPAKKTLDRFVISNSIEYTDTGALSDDLMLLTDGINVGEIVLSNDFSESCFEACMEAAKEEYPEKTDKELRKYAYMEMRMFLCNAVAKKFTVSKDNKYFATDASGVLYSKDMTVLIKYPVASPLTYYSLPETVDLSADDESLLAASPFQSMYGSTFVLMWLIAFSGQSGREFLKITSPDNLTVHVPAKVIETLCMEEDSSSFENIAGVNLCTDVLTENFEKIRTFIDEVKKEHEENVQEIERLFAAGEITEDSYKSRLAIADIEKTYIKSISVCGGSHAIDSIIKTPSTDTINYGETLVLHADLSGMPAPAKFEWVADGSQVSVKPIGDGKTCEVKSVGSGTVKVSVKVTDENGCKFTDSHELNSKAGLWQKIVSFFKNLFGINRIIPQAFKVIF